MGQGADGARDGAGRTLAGLLTAALLAALLLGAPAGAAPDATPARLAGGERTATAGAVARAAFPTPPSSRTALLARAGDFPDALAAAGLAGALDAPILLTPTDRLAPATAATLDDLAVERVVILGGASAISEAVVSELGPDRTVERIAGRDRYETAARIGAALIAAREADGAAAPDTVVIVRGDQFADALAGGAPAFAEGWPLLLTEPTRLPPAAAMTLDDLRPSRALVLGGAAAVGSEVVAALETRGIAVTRVAGPTRTGTARALADHLATRGWPVGTALLARGDDFADALAAAPLAGRERAPILLATAPDVLGDDGAAWLADRCPAVGRLVAVGGGAALSERTLDAAHHARLDCVPLPSPLELTYRVEAPDAATADALAGKAEGVLGDPRGWALDGAIRFRRITGAADLTLRLAPSEAIAAAHPACRPGRSCRVGDELWLDGAEWSAPPAAWRGREPDFRTYLINHLVGHWLGVPASSCAGGPAPVMADQTADLHGCTPEHRPSAAERERARRRHVPPVTLAFGGDVHGEGRVRSHLLAGGNPLSEVALLLQRADLAVVNLETAVGTSGRPQPGKTYTFQAPPVLLDALRAAGVDVVSLANNHALDYGHAALAETIALARAARVAPVGAGRNAAEAYAPALFRANRRTVAVVGLSRVLPAGWAAGPGRAGIASAYDVAAAERAVRAAAERADVVVVMIHWGVELAECPDGHQLDLARRLTAAGADVVAGHHPHVLQGIQRIGPSLVHLSLGNFVWYHSREPSRYTGVWTVEVDGRGAVADRFDPAVIDQLGRPVPATGALAARIAGDVAARSPGGGRCRF
jgi:poly-gamma-glutamate capsule biosynthesis protein CapA/YwtB (metallophosphatase superfamily)/putative cell wall-binding protein